MLRPAGAKFPNSTFPQMPCSSGADLQYT